jgi:8-oxo-dGTP diphosphatase
MPYTYDYPRPMVTADVLLFTGEGINIEILLIRRGHPPFDGCWALPGGFLEMDEELSACAERELLEETGISGLALQELFTAGSPGRDPRGRVITVIFYAYMKNRPATRAGDDASQTGWFRVSGLPALAFDHQQVISKAVAMLFSRV